MKLRLSHEAKCDDDCAVPLDVMHVSYLHNSTRRRNLGWQRMHFRPVHHHIVVQGVLGQVPTLSDRLANAWMPPDMLRQDHGGRLRP